MKPILKGFYSKANSLLGAEILSFLRRGAIFFHSRVAEEEKYENGRVASAEGIVELQWLKHLWDHEN